MARSSVEEGHSEHERETVDVVGERGDPPPRSSVRRRLEQLFADYGAMAIVTYFGIFFLTWAGFAGAIVMGVDVEGAAAGVGTIGAAWLATKVTQPLRIGATVVLTPVAARAWHRIRPRPVRVVAVSQPEEPAREVVHGEGPDAQAS